MFRAAALVAVIAILAMPATFRAQGTPQVTIRAASRDTMTVEAGTAVTAVFSLRNGGGDSVSVAPTITVPRGWRQVGAAGQISLAPNSEDTWLAGVWVPAAAVAGSYVVRAHLEGGADDSVALQVVARRRIEVLNLDAPGWVLSGSDYEARFLIRNGGNVRARVSLASDAGRSQTTIEPADLTLAPGASAVVRVRATKLLASQRTAEDVIHVIATDRDQAYVSGQASSLTTIVPRMQGANDFSTISSALALRSGGGASGVSPLVVTGAGMLVDNRTSVDFKVQAPTDQRSPWGFGERDEYRLNVAGPSYRARLGDNVYGYSTLTATGIMGSGAEFRASRSDIEGGAFLQRLRWTPGTPSEQGLFAGIGRDSALRANASLLFRQSAGSRGVAMATVGGTYRLPFDATAEGEFAISDSARDGGAAWRGQLAGLVRGVRYEASALRGSDRFTGSARGTRTTTLALSREMTTDLHVSASMTRRDWSHAMASRGRMGQHFSTATVTATWQGTTSLEIGRIARRDEGSASVVHGAQQSLRLTSGRQLGTVNATGSVEYGKARIARGESPAPYGVVSLTVSAPLGTYGTVGLSTSQSIGRTVTGANGDMLSAGANAQIRLPGGVEFGFVMSSQRATYGMLDTSGAWFSLTDARLEKKLDNGITVGLHARALQSPSPEGAAGMQSRALYLEARSPFRLPTAKSRAAGRAVGRVVDAERQTPIAGVLVRVGDQAAVSDKDGRVRFAGLDSVVHRVAVDPAAAAAGAMLVGDVMLDMSRVSELPSQFAVGVTRGARVVAFVQRSEGNLKPEPAGGPRSADPDYLPLDGVVVALEGLRDTLYQVTDAKGVADFGAVPPGVWTAAVRAGGDEAWMEYERNRIEVLAEPGSRSTVEFRLVPVQRQVRLMDGGASSLRAKPQPKPKDERP